MGLQAAPVGFFNGISELNNIVLTESPCTVGTVYSDEIEMGSRMFLNLSIRFVKGSLTTCTLKIQAWDGEGWIALKQTDGSSQWSCVLSADMIGSVVIGDSAGALEDNTRILWNRVRVEVVCAGTASGSSLKLRAAAK
jgi:hypothetical protein